MKPTNEDIIAAHEAALELLGVQRPYGIADYEKKEDVLSVILIVRRPDREKINGGIASNLFMVDSMQTLLEEVYVNCIHEGVTIEEVERVLRRVDVVQKLLEEKLSKLGASTQVLIDEFLGRTVQ